MDSVICSVAIFEYAWHSPTANRTVWLTGTRTLRYPKETVGPRSIPLHLFVSSDRLPGLVGKPGDEAL